MKQTPVKPEPEILPPSPTAHIGLEETKAAFLQQDHRRETELAANPVIQFLDRHEEAGSPNELTISGVADIKVTLGDLRRLVRTLR